MFSRYFQPYGIKRRLPVADRLWLDEPRQLRYVEIAVRLGSSVGQPERIALLVEKAGIDMGAGRTDSAMAALDEALATADTPQVRREIDYQRGRACLRARRNADAEAIFLRTLAATQPPDGLGRRALLQLGRTHISQGRYGDAIASLRRGLEGGGHTRQNQVGGHYDLVYSLVHEGLNAEADAVLDDAERGLDASETLALARLAYYRAWVAFARRDVEAAGAMVDDARREFVVHREFESVACADLLRACVDFERADLTGALQRCDAMLQSTAVLRADLLLAVLLLRGLTLFVIGRFAEAKAEYRRAARLGETQGLPLLQARALEWLGDAHGFCGEWEHARTVLGHAMTVRRSVGDRLGEAMALASMGNVERQTGGMAAAATYYDQARTLAAAIGSRWEVARIDGEQMEACFLAGDTRGAERHAAAAMAAYEGLGDSLRLARVLKHMGQIAAVRDEFDAAEEWFQRAIKLVDGDANRIVRAELLDSRAEARADAGRVDDALKDLAAAHVLAEPTGSFHLLNHIAAHAGQIRERHAAQNVLNRYMEPKIVSRLLARGPRRLVENVEQDATILFSDIRGFTHLTERLGPHEVVALLNEHFEAMTDEIVQRGGTIDKFIGDAVMAVFGDPGRPREDDALRAVQAAVAMVRRRTRLNLTRQAAGHAWIDIGVGVNTGTVVMGNIGSARRMNYTVIGDAVNVAARLEALTKVHGHPVLISAETRGRLAHDWQTIPLGHLEVKGRAGKVDMYAVPCDGDDAL